MKAEVTAVMVVVASSEKAYGQSPLRVLNGPLSKEASYSQSAIAGDSLPLLLES